MIFLPCKVFGINYSLYTFCLDAKSTKKIKAAANAPRAQPCQRTTTLSINY
jgi:hypothetical protein